MDVKASFLNKHLLEDVLRFNVKGFVNPKHPNKVFKLYRSIHGFKENISKLESLFS